MTCIDTFFPSFVMEDDSMIDLFDVYFEESQTCKTEVQSTQPEHNPNVIANTSELAGEKPTISGEFADLELWSCHYHRNNKRGGLKNLRCFPHCTDGQHKPKGFCGAPIKLFVRSSSPMEQTPELHVWIEINKFVRAREEKCIQVGNIISRRAVKSLERSSEKPYNPWIAGREILNDTEGEHYLGAFEFHHEKRGWHYGFVANKHLTKLQHCVRAYVFVPINPEDPNSDLRCCSIISSPPFTLTCRRRGKALEEQARLLEEAQNQLDSTNPSLGKRKLEQEDDSSQHSTKLVRPESIGELDHGNNPSSMEKCNMFFLLADNLLNLRPEEYNVVSKNERERPVKYALKCVAEYFAAETDLTKLIQDTIRYQQQQQQQDDSIVPVVLAVYARVQRYLVPFGLQIKDLAWHEREQTENKSADAETLLSSAFISSAGSVEMHVPWQPFSSSSSLSSPLSALPAPSPTSASSCHHVLASLAGLWMRSEELLQGLQHLYQLMRLPWLLRRFFLGQDAQFSLTHDIAHPDRITVETRRKLFSTGSFVYKVDGNQHPFSASTPLLLSRGMCKSYRAAWEEGVLCLEHYVGQYRMKRKYLICEHDIFTNATTVHVNIDLDMEDQSIGWKNLGQVSGYIIRL